MNHDQEPPQALSKAAPEDTQPATGTASPLTTRGPGNKVMTIDTFNDKQSQIAERNTGDGRGPGDCSKEAA